MPLHYCHFRQYDFQRLESQSHSITVYNILTAKVPNQI